MAVLAAIAVMAAALLLAETTLVYVALGLGAVSALFLVGAVVQGRFGGGAPNRERSGTDGLGKSSVPATTPARHERAEEPGRAPAPAYTPVREVSVPVESGHGAGPVVEGTGPEEPEFEVPRWETPAVAAWPVPDTADSEPEPSRGERSTAVETPGRDESPAPEAAPPPPETGAEPAPEPPGEEDASARFSYRIPAFSRTVEDDPATEREETSAPDETVAAVPEPGDTPDPSDGATAGHDEPEPTDDAPDADEDALQVADATAPDDASTDGAPTAGDAVPATDADDPDDEDATAVAEHGEPSADPQSTARTADDTEGDTEGEEPDRVR
ncbi:hypothetical protein ACIBFB_12285 [Nocardiopsis sp. NPDC050513]|uniref:hypothetical protein n=1 Tax=Nocardiopsis sp. NPDC050513 TaxID=3364338 RepID=UPI00378C3E9E